MKHDPKHDTSFRDGVRACLNALHPLLEQAEADAAEACGYVARGEQNMAVGTLVTLEGQLERAMVLYKAAIALHRSKG